MLKVCLKKMASENDSLDLKLSVRNLDTFYIRQTILNSIMDNMDLFEGKLLDVGCGKMPYRDLINKKSSIVSYHGLEINNAKIYDEKIIPDFFWDGRTMPFKSDEYDIVFATEVFEHCPDLQTILKESYRVLKPNGKIFFTVPFLWPLHEVPNDEYRYTPFALKKHLESAGFENIDIKATGGWHASLAQFLGLWVRRGVSNKKMKRILSFFFKPIISGLIKRDYVPVNFTEGQMCTGFYGTAKKN